MKKIYTLALIFLLPMSALAVTYNATFQWSPGVDPDVPHSVTSGVAGYHIYRNGVLIATTTIPLYTDSTLEPDTVYIFGVSAFDYAGNEETSATRTTTTVITPKAPDVTAPQPITGLQALLAFLIGALKALGI